MPEINDTTKPATRTTGVEDVVVTMATRLGLLLSGVAIQSLLAYALLPVGRGEFAVCILFAALAGVLFTPGADAGAQYFVMRKEITVSQGVASAVAICSAGGAVSAALAIPLIGSDIAFFRKADPASFHLALGLVPLTAFSNAVQHQLAGLRRFRALAIMSLVQTGTNTVALVCLVLVLQLGVEGALISSGMGNLVMIVACIRDLRRDADLRLEFPRSAELAGILRYGVKYYIGRLGWGVDLRVGVLVLSMIAERVEIGLFAVASGLLMRFVVISNAIFAPLLPRAAKDHGGRPDLVSFCSRVTTCLTGGALVLMLVFHVPIVRILLSSEFLPSATLIRIIAPGILIFSGGNILTAYFRGVGRPGICSWAVTLGLCINVIAIPLLYPRIGVEAAAWAMTAGLFGRSLLLSVAFHRMTQVHPALGWLLQRDDIPRLVALVRKEVTRVLNRAPGGAGSNSLV